MLDYFKNKDTKTREMKPILLTEFELYYILAKRTDELYASTSHAQALFHLDAVIKICRHLRGDFDEKVF